MYLRKVKSSIYLVKIKISIYNLIPNQNQNQYLIYLVKIKISIYLRKVERSIHLRRVKRSIHLRRVKISIYKKSENEPFSGIFQVKSSQYLSARSKKKHKNKARVLKARQWKKNKIQKSKKKYKNKARGLKARQWKKKILNQYLSIIRKWKSATI